MEGTVLAEGAVLDVVGSLPGWFCRAAEATGDLNLGSCITAPSWAGHRNGSTEPRSLLTPAPSRCSEVELAHACFVLFFPAHQCFPALAEFGENPNSGTSRR